ncbi:MAG: hypothetical protein KKH98_10440 [Spirochaetes bacterium]|nr:hypothetical protein [Spirochaetota bacterium]
MMRRFFPVIIGFFILLAIMQCGGSKVVLRDIPPEKRSSLAVLRFKNQSSVSEYNPWEMGLSSMVMTDLSKIGVFNINFKGIIIVSLPRLLILA